MVDASVVAIALRLVFAMAAPAGDPPRPGVAWSLMCSTARGLARAGHEAGGWSVWYRDRPFLHTPRSCTLRDCWSVVLALPPAGELID